jgi:hypothetical protein
MWSDSHFLKLWKELVKIALSLLCHLHSLFEGWSENKFILHVLWVIFSPNKKTSGVIVQQGFVLLLFDLCPFALMPLANLHHF